MGAVGFALCLRGVGTEHRQVRFSPKSWEWERRLFGLVIKSANRQRASGVQGGLFMGNGQSPKRGFYTPIRIFLICVRESELK